jgi:hypothetical protein
MLLECLQALTGGQPLAARAPVQDPGPSLLKKSEPANNAKVIPACRSCSARDAFCSRRITSAVAHASASARTVCPEGMSRRPFPGLSEESCVVCRSAALTRPQVQSKVANTDAHRNLLGPVTVLVTVRLCDAGCQVVVSTIPYAVRTKVMPQRRFELPTCGLGKRVQVHRVHAPLQLTAA